MRGHSIVPAPVLRQARQQLIEQGRCAHEALDERLTRSWQRSAAAGLLPAGRLGASDNLAGVALQRARVHNHELMSHSQPVMEYLFEQVRLSHSMVILADRQGMLLQTLGDLDFLSKAERVALACGASWHESQRGTNAIGTALAEVDEVEIHGAEHYLERNAFLTCAAAPIRSSTGELLGILDISGDHRGRHPHTLGLVSTAARMIENSLMLSSCRHQVLVRFHPLAAGIGSMAQGVLALAEDGWWVGANRRALELLRVQARDIGGLRLEQVFDVTMDTVLAHGQRQGGRPLVLRSAAGAIFYAQVEAPARVALKAGAPVVSPRGGAVRTVEAPRVDALDQLDTGDPRWRSAAAKARRVIDKAIPLLLQGESGVGKEVFAKAVHETSSRCTGPFVAINCAALPESLIEAELFGYTPGAFTGARREGAVGRLREAHGGTLFLDEIGDMPLAMQTRLLRVLQERQVSPLGGGAAVNVDFALICATHHSLREAVDAGRFRSDLYYRINGLTVQLPALRERADFEALTQRLVYEASGSTAVHVSAELLQALRAYRWPGNLRQVANVLRTAVAMLEPHEVTIDWAHMPDDLIDDLPRGGAAAVAAAPENLAALSQRAIAQALENARGNVSAAARQLGISRQTLYRRLSEKR